MCLVIVRGGACERFLAHWVVLLGRINVAIVGFFGWFFTEVVTGRVNRS